ncbi:MAG: twin-arginine translocase TatA/TatE family subunit [Calditrichaeota bacterium]|nr:MAG: twin-arginine translocase TatA/TatE family subunit [Calditrichota bacterium]
MFSMGPAELVLIFLIFVLLFGAKRLPQLARGMGEGITEFKRGLKAIDEARSETTNPKLR